MVAKDSRSYRRTKYINIRNYFYREKVANKIVIF